MKKPENPRVVNGKSFTYARARHTYPLVCLRKFQIICFIYFSYLKKRRLSKFQKSTS